MLEFVKKVKVVGLICFCMGVVWKNLYECDMFYLEKMVEGVKVMGMEICMILGILDK